MSDSTEGSISMTDDQLSDRDFTESEADVYKEALKLPVFDEDVKEVEVMSKRHEERRDTRWMNQPSTATATQPEKPNTR